MYVSGLGPPCPEEGTWMQLSPQPAGQDIRASFLLHECEVTVPLYTHVQPYAVTSMLPWSGAHLVQAAKFG
jgi:hypothetical protein